MLPFFRAKSVFVKMMPVFLSLMFLMSLLVTLIDESKAEEIESENGRPYSKNMIMPLVITETVKLVADNPEPDDKYGYDLAFEGDTLIVSAPQDDDAGTDAGAVYIYYRNQGGVNNWGLVTKLVASDAVSEQRFGAYVSLDGDTLVVGAVENSLEGNNSPGTGNGSAYVFYRDQGGANNWGQVRKGTQAQIATTAAQSGGYSSP